MIQNLTYTYETSHVVKPSDVYTAGDERVKGFLKKHLLTHQIIAFRPPKDGESFIGAWAAEYIYTAPRSYLDPAKDPRFIVVPRPPLWQALEDVWS